jgi:hypothetical protein
MDTASPAVRHDIEKRGINKNRPGILLACLIDGRACQAAARGEALFRIVGAIRGG